jgi:adenylate kinase family enzyme
VKRFNIIGTSGSGKSTFAKKLASALEIPHIEMDKIFWGPNWEWPSDEVFFSKLKKELDREAWVLDGNYTRTVPIKWEQVDLIVWLDYSFPRTLLQAVRRAISRAWSQQELWEGTGNKESFRQSFFSKKSIIWWTITTYGQVQKKYASYLTEEKFAHLKFVRLRSHLEAEEFIAGIKTS